MMKNCLPLTHLVCKTHLVWIVPLRLLKVPAGHAEHTRLAVVVGAVAVGALAIGAVAIGRLAVGQARFRRLEIDELVVGRLILKD